MRCLKLLGERLMAVRHGPRTGAVPGLTFDRQTTEPHVRAVFPDRFTQPGTPETQRVA